jgi:dTDP-4-dehydrorhamnose 3,5-epimerase
MEFIETRLKGAYLIRPNRIEDHRGFFARTWCRDEFLRHGLNPDFLQMNMGVSAKKGTLRGLHFQLPPHAEAKFVRCPRGAVFDVIVDLRPDSPTCRQWAGYELTGENAHQLYVPEGFAHGYQTLADNVELNYLTTAAYAPATARGVRYDDPAFDIRWPLPVAAISDADRQYPDFLG